MGRAVFVHETGGAEVLRVAAHEPGDPGPGAVQVRLAAAGVNFIDIYSLAHYTRDRAELEQRAGAVLGAVARGELEVRIGAEFPLADAAGAHRALEGRRTTGKVLLRP